MQMNNMPVGWSFKRVQDMGRVITGSTPPMSDTENYGGDFCWATAQDFKSKYIKNTVVKLSNKGKGVARVLPASSVLVTCIASIGLNAIAQTEMATNQQINAIVPNSNFDSEFLYYLFCYNTDKLKQYAGGGGILILSKREFEKIRFMVPAFEEQKKIAEILGTWDRAIEELTDLIAEKKELKRGLMQRLLTGTQRLPGFSASWKQVKLAKLFDVKKGAGLSKDVLDKEGKESCILYGELYTTYPEIVRSVISRTDISEGVRSEYGDILIPGSTTTTGIDLANATALLEKGVLLGGDINILRKKQELSSEFFAYLLTHAYRFELAKLAQGITIVHLYGESLKNVDVVVPTDTAEQKAIADVLSKADAEIDLLNQRLDVLKEQKRGLMQKLLTGEIRVKVDKE